MEPPPELVEGEEVYEVETILNHRRRGRQYQYFIKWQGYPISNTSWELEHAFSNDGNTLKRYKLRHHLWHHIALHLVQDALWLFWPIIQPKLGNYRMFRDSLRDPWQSGGYRNCLVEKGHISHPFPTIQSFQNYWKILLKTVNKVFLLRLLHYSPQQHKLWNHIPLRQTLTLDSRTWQVQSHHYNFYLKTLWQLSDTVTRTIRMKPIVQEYQQRKHFHLHRHSPSSSTTSHLPILKSYIKGLNLMEMDIPWVTHQHHTMPTLMKKLKVGDSVMSIVFDDKEPWPLQGEVGTVKDQRCRNALIPKPNAEESGAQQWMTNPKYLPGNVKSGILEG